MIFGTSYPALKDKNNTLVLFEHSTLTVDWNKNVNLLENKSVLNGDLTENFLERYCEISVTVNLFKYTNPSDKFNELYPLLHTTINEFWTNYDGISIRNYAGTKNKFFVYSITMGKVWQDLNGYDTATLLLKPVTNSDIQYSALLTGGIQ